MEIDKTGGLVPANKKEQGVITKVEDGVVKEYNLIDEGDDFDFVLDDTIDNLEDNMTTADYKSIVVNKPKATNNLEQQIISSLEKQVDNYVDKVLSNPKIKQILSKRKNWVQDNDFLNVIATKVVEVSNGQLMFETVKNSIKQRYE